MVKVKKELNSLQDYDEWMSQQLKNKKSAAKYLQAALEEYQENANNEALMVAFRHVAMAQGGIAHLAKKTELNRETLYRTLSNKGNPKLLTLGKLLDGLGFKLAIEPN